MTNAKREEILNTAADRLDMLPVESRNVVEYCLDQVLYGGTAKYYDERPAREHAEIDTLLTVTLERLNRHRFRHAHIYLDDQHVTA